ncbi:MAG: cyclopropane fatty acid synthase [Actinomycetia bacterium]|nr:cyclopropane fatty acid synthase [Actinomycetes bacterium]
MSVLMSDPSKTVGGIAGKLADRVTALLGTDLPCRIRAWDGSEWGPGGGPVVVIRSRRALRRFLWKPDELGIARAYVTGDLDVEGDIEEGFRRLRRFGREHGKHLALHPRDYLGLAGTLAGVGAIGLPPKRPTSEAQVKGRLHSKLRDSAVIAHHYDLSNDFYELILDESMAYSSAYWTSDGPDYGLADAQTDKLDLVCRKLGLKPGMRMLDVGCGWGSLSIHAARDYGATVTGVTLSREQLDFARKRVADLGLQEQVDLRLQDYRDVDDGPYDVATSIEMGEHVGKENYPTFVGALFRLLGPEGRVVIQQMSRSGVSPGGGPFIEAYIAPDMHMRPVGETVALLEQGGFEVRDVEAMREHYARTIRAWHATFEASWDEAVSLVGEETARVWRLYLVGALLTFDDGSTGVDQILAVKPADGGSSGMAPTRAEWAVGDRHRRS